MISKCCNRCGRRFDSYKSDRRIYCGMKCAAISRRTPRVTVEWSRLRQIWRGMQRRCYSVRCVEFPYYGGRGITVCRKWLDSFESFFYWSIANGYKDELEIDRRNTNAGYTPTNCRWATRVQQMRNTRKRSNAKTSKYKGVSWCANVGKWRAQINGTPRSSKHIGLFTSERSAALAYDLVAIKEFGEFASINFPRKESALS